ncbi:hypothetical protein GCM10009584_07550 [Ornithinimicrobium humiphilum]|uniref:Helix-turn-helix protein n=1 Tax=Ornithinimicrobium humiphilum TaxID=125288 RepID=A0A543KQD3_9MICO|nr:helix-turn-helix transcriptional regulator [Ornithinimicrobium humiphilum]TQM97268.1 helix-turn-helix protein [Ornithinimicrobium humiphilum]
MAGDGRPAPQSGSCGGAGGTPLLDAAASRLLAATALATFPSTYRPPDLRRDSADAHPRALRRALAHIDGHLDRDLSLADAAAVSVRTLQLAFQRHLGTTPSAYLRRARLEQAHRDLLRSSPEETTVAAAARWGFLSSSRFAAHYQQVYAQPPSRTLRG